MVSKEIGNVDFEIIVDEQALSIIGGLKDCPNLRSCTTYTGDCAVLETCGTYGSA